MITLPDDTPVTTPLLFTVALPVLLLVQVPPAVPVDVNVIVEPTQTEEAPLMVPAFAELVTANDLVAVDVPQPVTT